jgi:hypothetical protein
MVEGSATKKSLWPGIVLCVLIVGVGTALWGVYLHRAQELPGMCPECQRPIQANMAFSAKMGDRAHWFCCPRCWVTSRSAGEPGGTQPMAADFISGEMTAADQCVYVEGSDAPSCCAAGTTVGMDKVPAVAGFDRCYPSTIAFRDSKEALHFTQSHGGLIVSFQTLADEALKQ